MVKWHFYSAFQSTDRSKCFSILVTFIHLHTHSDTDGGGQHARCQLLIRSNAGFSILLKDTSACSWGNQGKQTSNLIRQPALPPELQTPTMLHVKTGTVCFQNLSKLFFVCAQWYNVWQILTSQFACSSSHSLALLYSGSTSFISGFNIIRPIIFFVCVCVCVRVCVYVCVCARSPSASASLTLSASADR